MLQHVLLLISANFEFFFLQLCNRGPILPTGLLTVHCATVGRLHTLTSLESQSLAMWFQSFCDSLTSTWLASDLQQTPTLSKLSTSGCTHSTATSSTQGYKPSCHGETNVEVWRVPSATHIPCVHRKQNKFLGMGLCVTLVDLLNRLPNGVTSLDKRSRIFKNFAAF